MKGLPSDIHLGPIHRGYKTPQRHLLPAAAGIRKEAAMHGPESHRPIVPTRPRRRRAQAPQKRGGAGEIPANAMHTDKRQGRFTQCCYSLRPPTSCRCHEHATCQYYHLPFGLLPSSVQTSYVNVPLPADQSASQPIRPLQPPPPPPPITHQFHPSSIHSFICLSRD